MIYQILDNYGTRQSTWTFKGAMSWLPYCALAALIRNRFTGKILARRVVREITQK